MRQTKYEYDAFISHAVEDKIPIANELCAKLERAGLRIWYSGKELGVGDSIEKTIEKGLHRSRYGIVILSPTYLAKNWTIREFYTLLAKEIEEQKVILPVLYNVTVDDLKKKDLLMADRFAVDADRGLDFVVEKLMAQIKKPKVAQQKVAWLSRIWLVLILSLLANIFLLFKSNIVSPADHYTLSGQHAGLADPNQFAGHSLLNEMQRIAGTINQCTCEERNDNYQHGANHITLTSSRPQLQTLSRKAPAPTNAGHLEPGSKMTMAVVFQIETPRQTNGSTTTQANETPEPVGGDQDDTWISLSTSNNAPANFSTKCIRHGAAPAR